MGVSFAGYDCLDPVSLRDQLLARNLPCDWFGKPNSYECPDGTEGGTGYVLLTRAALDALDLNGLYPFVVTSQETPTQVTSSVRIQSLCIVDAVCVSPQELDAATSAYLVRISDRRWLYRHIPIDKAYNVRLGTSADDPPVYYPATTKSGTTWTWQELFADIWQLVPGLGDVPNLPVTPSGTPENFQFWGRYAMEALREVLAHLSCRLVLDPLADGFAVVEAAAEDDDAAASLADTIAQRAWDDEPIQPVRGRVPSCVKVVFRKQLAVPDTQGESPYYYVTQSDPNGTAAGVETDSAVLLPDGLAALYDADGNLLNSSDLNDRAAARAADYFRVLRQEPLRRVLGRPQADSSLTPGSQLTVTRWGDRGRGSVQEVKTEPTPAVAPLPPQPEAAEAYVKPTSATRTLIALPGSRTVSDGSITSGSTTLTSSTANFTSADVGSAISGTGIADGTTIQSVTNVTTVTLSTRATATASNVALLLGPQTPGYAAVLTGWRNRQGDWQDASAAVWWKGINGEVPDTGARYPCRFLGVDQGGIAIWGTRTSCLAWVKVTSSTVQAVGLSSSRSVSDASTTSGSTTLTSSTANFTSGDVGAAVGGNGIRNGTTISSITDSSHAVLSQSATATASNVNVVIGLQIQGYTAVLDPWDHATGQFSPGAAVWFDPVNGERPVSGSIYQCRFLDTASDGKTIWAAASFATNNPEGYVTASSPVSVTPSTIQLSGGGTTTGWAGTYAGGSCWLLAELNGNVPPVAGWIYQARWNGQFDTNNKPLFQVAFDQPAGIVLDQTGAYIAASYGGIVTPSVQRQWFAGDKGVTTTFVSRGNLTVGYKLLTGDSGFADATVNGKAIAFELIAAGDASGYSQSGLARYTVRSAGGIEFGGLNGSSYDSSEGTGYTASLEVEANPFSGPPDGRMAVLTRLGGSVLGVGDQSICFDSSYIYVSMGGVMTQAATGTDPVGTVFANGLSVVSNGSGGAGVDINDYGSFY